MTQDVFLSVIIPAYNEAKRIGPTLEDVSSFLLHRPYYSEIIVVDDGSKDDTVSVVREYQSKVKNLRLLDGEDNQGKGHAVQRGMQAAAGKWRLFMDADNSVSIRHIGPFLREGFAGYDVVIGSIAHPASTEKVVEHNGWHRRFLGSLSKLLIRIFATPGIYDTQRGFKLFSERAARKIFKRQTVQRFGFDIELLVIARLKGFRIRELPVSWDNPDGSTVRPSDYWKTLQELGAIMSNRLTHRYN